MTNDVNGYEFLKFYAKKINRNITHAYIISLVEEFKGTIPKDRQEFDTDDNSGPAQYKRANNIVTGYGLKDE